MTNDETLAELRLNLTNATEKPTKKRLPRTGHAINVESARHMPEYVPSYIPMDWREAPNAELREQFESIGESFANDFGRYANSSRAVARNPWTMNSQ